MLQNDGVLLDSLLLEDGLGEDVTLIVLQVGLAC